MVYDAATGTVVLFGGDPHLDATGGQPINETWTWNGTTWAQQHPATSPPGLDDASMAYDAATGNVVLFGGCCNDDAIPELNNDTWVWNGTTWTQQHPATRPPARDVAGMAYDTATGNVVLFGGDGLRHVLNDTWVWDGTAWTKQHPATSPHPREDASMAYDAATGNVVLFGGSGRLGAPNDTWTWDGTTWTKQHTATHPPVREGAAMTYDAATGNVVLFGGQRHTAGTGLQDTWVWDGTTWTLQTPAHRPPKRAYPSMTYDAATGNMVLFGGINYKMTDVLNDTWTWG